MHHTLGRQRGDGVTRLVSSACALAATIAVGALLVACSGLSSLATPAGGPGSPAPRDPFVGAWRMDRGDRWRFVISADGSIYSMVVGKPGKLRYLPADGSPFTRTDDKLTGYVVHGSSLDRLVIALGKEPESLLLTETGRDLDRPRHATLTRLSTSTATPIPVP
jgi:hypothetical protein